MQFENFRRNKRDWAIRKIFDIARDDIVRAQTFRGYSLNGILIISPA